MKLCVYSKYHTNEDEFFQPQRSSSFCHLFHTCSRKSYEIVQQYNEICCFRVLAKFFLPLVKRLHTFDIAKPFLFSFYFHFHSFVISFYKQTARPDFKITFTKHCNPLECSMFFPNDHIGGLTTVAVMVSSLRASRFYTVFTIQFPRGLLLLFFIHFPKF